MSKKCFQVPNEPSTYSIEGKVHAIVLTRKSYGTNNIRIIIQRFNFS